MINNLEDVLWVLVLISITLVGIYLIFTNEGKNQRKKQKEYQFGDSKTLPRLPQTLRQEYEDIKKGSLFRKITAGTLLIFVLLGLLAILVSLINIVLK